MRVRDEADAINYRDELVKKIKTLSAAGGSNSSNSYDISVCDRKLKALSCMTFCDCGRRTKERNPYCPGCGKPAPAKTPSPHTNCVDWKPNLPFCGNCGKPSFSYGNDN